MLGIPKVGYTRAIAKQWKSLGNLRLGYTCDFAQTKELGSKTQFNVLKNGL